jgi:hypothetical protein
VEGALEAADRFFESVPAEWSARGECSRRVRSRCRERPARPSAAKAMAHEGDVVGDGRFEEDIKRTFGRPDLVADFFERVTEHVALVLVGRGVDGLRRATSASPTARSPGALMKPSVRLVKAQARRRSAIAVEARREGQVADALTGQTKRLRPRVADGRVGLMNEATSGCFWPS